MERSDGFIMLSRKLFSSDMWETPRTYSSCEAWIDLIQSARFEATPLTASIGGREITYGRGQYPASIRFLAKRWRWTEKQVRSFLDRLKRQGRITTECKQGMNVITLCKYEEYNSCTSTVGTAKGIAEGTDTELIFKELDNIKAQLTAQQGHSEGTKKNKAKTEESKRVCVSPIIPIDEDFKAGIETSQIKELLLLELPWKEQMCQQSGFSIKFMDMLPGQIDNFLSWIQVIGEEKTLLKIEDAKRRFYYWWRDTGSKEWNKLNNIEDDKRGTKAFKPTSGTATRAVRSKAEETADRNSSGASQKDYSERF